MLGILEPNKVKQSIPGFEVDTNGIFPANKEMMKYEPTLYQTPPEKSYFEFIKLCLPHVGRNYTTDVKKGSSRGYTSKMTTRKTEEYLPGFWSCSRCEKKRVTLPKNFGRGVWYISQQTVLAMAFGRSPPEFFCHCHEKM